jgi:hypothetical protein
MSARAHGQQRFALHKLLGTAAGSADRSGLVVAAAAALFALARPPRCPRCPGESSETTAEPDKYVYPETSLSLAADSTNLSCRYPPLCYALPPL